MVGASLFKFMADAGTNYQAGTNYRLSNVTIGHWLRASFAIGWIRNSRVFVLPDFLLS